MPTIPLLPAILGLRSPLLSPCVSPLRSLTIRLLPPYYFAPIPPAGRSPALGLGAHAGPHPKKGRVGQKGRLERPRQPILRVDIQPQTFRTVPSRHLPSLAERVRHSFAQPGRYSGPSSSGTNLRPSYGSACGHSPKPTAETLSASGIAVSSHSLAYVPRSIMLPTNHPMKSWPEHLYARDVAASSTLVERQDARGNDRRNPTPGETLPLYGSSHSNDLAEKTPRQVPGGARFSRSQISRRISPCTRRGFQNFGSVQTRSGLCRKFRSASKNLAAAGL
jgi:hypothetical protein